MSPGQVHCALNGPLSLQLPMGPAQSHSTRALALILNALFKPLRTILNQGGLGMRFWLAKEDSTHNVREALSTVPGTW